VYRQEKLKDCEAFRQKFWTEITFFEVAECHRKAMIKLSTIHKELWNGVCHADHCTRADTQCEW